MTDRFETFATTIAVMNRCITKIKSREMRKLGLKSTHVMCLYSLGKEPGGLTASDLCKLCKEDKAAISRSIRELEEKGYVYLDTESNKRAYRTRIFLTERGKKTVAYMQQRVEHALDVVGSGLDETQRSVFYETLALIAEQLQAYVEQ